MTRTMPFVQSGLPKMAPVRGGGFQMPSVRGGSSKPSQQEQAVIETVTVESIPPVEDLSYMYTDSKPVSMPDMSLIEEPKKISPMTYAIGAAALLLGGWYFLRN